MKNNQLELLLANVGQVLNLMNGLNINKEAIATHAATLKTVRIKLDKLKEQYSDKAYMAILSPAESKAILDNAQANYNTHQELVKEIEYLDMAKHPSYLTNAVNELTHAFLLIEWLSEEIGKSGRTILPHLTCIRVDTFNNGKYRTQIETMYSELEAISYDFYVDQVFGLITPINPVLEGYSDRIPMLIPISDHLTVAACWLKKEKERLLTEALPETKKIDLPTEIFPEIPKGPKDELKN